MNWSMNKEELLLLCERLAGNKAQSRLLVEALFDCHPRTFDESFVHKTVEFISQFQDESYFVNNWMRTDNAVEFDEYFKAVNAQYDRNAAENCDWEEIKSLIHRNLEEHESLSPGESRTMNSEINRIVEDCLVIDNASRIDLPPLRAFNPNLLVEGRFLDRGSFGDVLKGTLRGVDVAIKNQRISGADMRKEAMILQLRSLPGVIRFFGVDDPENPTMIVMEAGVCSLSGWLYKPEFQAELGELTLKQKLRVLYECASTLAFLHGLNVLHRDVKPGNIIIMRSGKIKLSDFGCARLFTEMHSEIQSCSSSSSSSSCIMDSRGTKVIGTLAYMAPELILSEPVYSSATDMYAFGVTMNEVLSGVVPHKEVSTMAVYAAMISSNGESRPDLFSLPTEIAGLVAVLKECVMRCWDGSPTKRLSAFSISLNIDRCLKKRFGDNQFYASQKTECCVEKVLIASGHASTGYYTGWMVANKRHGKGHFEAINGFTYDGDWKDDMMDGRGALTSKEGHVYDGEWKKSLKDGFGIITYIDGQVYEGNWRNNYRWGHGTCTFPDGSCYVGEWLKSKKHGHGVYTYADGSSYEGDFKDGERHGRGLYKHSNGASYEGDWQNGARDGHGTMRYVSGDVFEGEWKQDQACGHGTLTKRNGQSFSGEWINSLEGHGVYDLGYGPFEGAWKFTGEGLTIQCR